MSKNPVTSWEDWIKEEQFRRYRPANSNFSTYLLSFCCLIQLQMLYNLPTSLVLSELDSALPCSEEEWSAETADKWWTLRNSGAPPTPSFQDALAQLFHDCDGVRYSEFAGYIMISAILSAIFDAHRLSCLPSGTVNFEKFDVALDNWQRLWLAGGSNPIGALAFNSSAVYRAASVMRVRDYTRCLFNLSNSGLRRLYISTMSELGVSGFWEW
jgi:hypothetical protein